MAGRRFGSVCSGIEAASVAWKPMGWRAAWFAEIEPFPSAVLKHHYPDTPNLGDMTALPDRIRSGEAEAPDLFCGGTPCQAFSVAGLRKSLDDARGNLSLTFCEIANAIDDVRRARGDDECIVFWENVPGVLSTQDNAFGCFLSALAGCDTAIDPLAATGWTNAGVVAGPQRTVAWRVLDAQYFGLAQRRRRVFVVASAREGFDPVEVLLEFDGVRRDTAPSREAGEAVAVCATLRAGGNSTGGDRPPGTDVDTADSLQVVAYGGNNTAPVNRQSRTPGDPCHTLARSNAEHAVVMGPVGFTRCDHGGDAVIDGTPTMRCGSNYSAHLAVAFHPTQDPISSTEVCHAIGANENATAAVAVDTYNHTVTGDYTGSLTTTGGPPLSGPGILQAMQVRRLTPRECERLQGFPDDYTAIPWRGKPASECPDGPRYKALGNSWAVPVVRWIGERINRVELALELRREAA